MRKFEAAVGELAVRKHGRRDRQVRGDGGAQVRHVVGLQGRHRHEGEKRVARAQLAEVRQQLRARPHAIDLVHRGDRRPPGARQAREHQLILRSPGERLHHQHHEVGVLERGGRGAVHGLVEGAARPGVQPRGVDERDLRLRQAHDAEDAVAGGLRARRDDGQLGADQRIEQRRLADVRPPDQGGKTAAKIRSRGTQLGLSVGGSISSSMRRAASCSARRRLEPRPSQRSSSPGTSQLTRKVCS